MSSFTSSILQNEIIVDEKFGIATHSRGLNLQMYRRYYQDGYTTQRPDLRPFQYMQWHARVMLAQRYFRIRKQRLFEELVRAKTQYSISFLKKHREVFFPEALTFTMPITNSGLHETITGWKNRSELANWMEKLLDKFANYGLLASSNLSEEERSREVNRVTKLYRSKIQEQ